MSINRRPNSITLLGIKHTITYVDNPSEVDIFRRQSLWGQYDPWTRTIRVYERDRTDEDIWQTLIHELLHGIASNLHLKALSGEENHDELDILALALADVLFRNGWISFDSPEGK